MKKDLGILMHISSLPSEYGIGKNHKIKILVSSDGDVNLYLRTNSDQIPSTGKVWISGVYYREYYDL